MPDGEIRFGDELAEACERYPGLKLTRPGVCRGTIALNASFDGLTLSDEFEIQISGDSSYPLTFPTMHEVGGRTEGIRIKHNIRDSRDLHCLPASGAACLCVPQDRPFRFPPGAQLVDFISNLVVPYLYGLSFFDLYGRWPWREFSHGEFGLLEFHGERADEATLAITREICALLRRTDNWKEFSRQVRRPSALRLCPCGSRKPFSQCHPSAWRGLARLSADVSRVGANPRALFAV